MKGKKCLEELLTNEIIIEEYKNEINEYIENLEQQVKKQKEVIDNIAKYFNDGNFADGCDCLIIQKYIDSYLKEVSE